MALNKGICVQNTKYKELALEKHMFNLKKKLAQTKPYEKYLRDENVGPVADDSQPIWEKSLKHWQGDKDKVIEDQMQEQHSTESKDAEVVEKVLNKAESYVSHRNDGTWLPMPAINAVVEKMRQNRAEDYNEQKEAHWSLTYDEKGQFGDLPKWPKNAPQHDKLSLPNDPRRFEDMDHLPAYYKQPDNDAARKNEKDVKPLVGDLTTADVDRVVANIKTGKSMDYDSAIYAILNQCDTERRELTPVEQKTISELKIARTQSMLTK